MPLFHYAAPIILAWDHPIYDRMATVNAAAVIRDRRGLHDAGRNFFCESHAQIASVDINVRHSVIADQDSLSCDVIKMELQLETATLGILHPLWRSVLG